MNYFLVPLYTYQFLDTAEYGIVGEFYAYISFLNILFTYGMETALFNFSSKELNKDAVYSTSLISILSTSLILFLPFVLFPEKVAALLDHDSLGNYVFWTGVILFTDAICAIPFAKLREQNRPGRFALLKSINILINISINVFFLWFCKNEFDARNNEPGSDPSLFGVFYDPSIGIGYIFIANGVANIITTLLLLPQFLIAKFVFDTTLWKRMMRYASPLIIVGFAGMINETLDRILLKYFIKGPDAMAQVGIYNACYKIAILMTIFIQAFRYAAEPFFFAHEKEKDSKKTYSRIMTWFVIACSVIFLGTMMNISWIQYFIGKPYRDGLEVVPILLLANLFLGVYFNLSIWYKLTGQTQYGAYITLFGAAITLAINIAFIPAFGFIASAWATFACYGAMMIASWLLGNKHYPVDYELKRILGYLALSVVLYGASCLLPETGDILEVLTKNGLFLVLLLAVYLFEKPRLKTA